MSLLTRDLHTGVVLQGIDWATYELLRNNPDNWHVRMTYEQGTLEMMSPLSPHEDVRRCLALMIQVWALELDIAIRGKGSLTFQAPDQERALEPDECYYIRREREIRGKYELDLAIDPPPDLSIEVEITSHWLDKGRIYAKLGVPELWRVNEHRIAMYRLVPKRKTYSKISKSLNLPGFPVADFERWLASFRELDETTWLKSWRDWIRSSR